MYISLRSRATLLPCSRNITSSIVRSRKYVRAAWQTGTESVLCIYYQPSEVCMLKMNSRDCRDGGAECLRRGASRIGTNINISRSRINMFSVYPSNRATSSRGMKISRQARCATCTSELHARMYTRTYTYARCARFQR